MGAEVFVIYWSHKTQHTYHKAAAMMIILSQVFHIVK
jgi:hypothetical protein